MAARAAVVIIKVFKGLRGDRCRWTVVKLGGPERDRDGGGVRSRSQGGDDHHRTGEIPPVSTRRSNHRSTITLDRGRCPGWHSWLI